MARLNKLNMVLNGALAQVSSVIRNEWNPAKLSSELKYRDSLAAFLRESAPDARVEVEYRHEGTTVDVYFKKEGFLGAAQIFIELKYNLRQKGEYDRLVGQLEQINPKKRRVIVVLCGDQHNESLLARLQERYKKAFSPMPLEENSPEIIIKASAEKSLAAKQR